MPLAKRLVAAVLLFLFLSVHVVSASPALHKQLHHDAETANHECVFVQVSSGHCLGTVQLIVLPERAVVVTQGEAVSEFIFVSRDCPLQPGRAPPLSPA